MKFNIHLKARVDNRSIDATVRTKANIGPTVITFDALYITDRCASVYRSADDPPHPCNSGRLVRENAKT